MREWVSLNGQLVSGADARVSVFDSGFMQGVGLFETMRAYHGRVFRLQAHLERLVNSARHFTWAVLPEQGALHEAVVQAVGACETAARRVRLTVTTGSLRAGADELEQPQLTVVASASGGGAYPPELYEEGAVVAVSRFRQNPHDATTGHKTTSYLGRLAALREAHQRQALEALWFTLDGFLAEGSISNIFLVRDGVLHTPPLTTPVLPGITRAAVLQLTGALGLTVHEAPLRLDDVLNADEVFLTNSMMELLPVRQIEREPIGAARPGPITTALAAAYRALVTRETSDGAAS